MPENQTAIAEASAYPESVTPELREMIEAGVFYGRKKNKTNPKMKSFVLLNRGGVEIFDLAKTAEAMGKAAGFLAEKVNKSGLVLFAATQPAAEGIVSRLAKKFNFPYVTTRWAGGTITNFGVISKRIEHFKKLRADLASGALEKYTKKERLVLERELKRLEELFGGLEALTKIPDVLVLVDSEMHSTAVREAKIKKIPIVALSNVDTDLDLIDYLVPGNDNAKRSIEWFFAKIEAAIEKGLAQKAEFDVNDAKPHANSAENLG